jgi:ubiquinone/menaquinone biosynthesis C-methylase UbiE
MAAKKKRKFPVGIGDALLSEERLSILEPSAVMDFFGIRKGSVIMDVGCGPGAFLSAASARVGDRGRVIAVDVQEPFIIMSKALAEQKGLHNVSFILSEEDKIPAAGGTVDAALMVTCMHEFDGDGTLKEVRRILKKNGVLGIVEWEKTKTPMGPPVSERLSQEESENLIVGAGFVVEKIFQAGAFHYGIFARKNA